MGLAVILTVLFGPLGMFYSTVIGGVIMLVASVILGHSPSVWACLLPGRFALSGEPWQ